MVLRRSSEPEASQALGSLRRRLAQMTSNHTQPNVWVALMSGAGLVCTTIEAIIRGRTRFFRQRVTTTMMAHSFGSLLLCSDS